MSWYPPYVSVAKKRAKAEKKLKSLKKKMPNLQPVVLEGRSLARTWWGKSWNKNLERYADYSNRIGRGRSYVRHRAVLDLKITSGKVTALVLGSARKPYGIEIRIKPVKPAKWAVLRRDCQGQLQSMSDLLAGKFPEALSYIFFAEDSGLFPVPGEISFDCSCPDWAEMCKHVAAALYGIGARLDEEPQLFFKLRGVNIEDLITQAVKDKSRKMLQNSRKKSSKVIADADLGAVFGVEMESEPNFGKKAKGSTKPKKPGPKVAGRVNKDGKSGTSKKSRQGDQSEKSGKRGTGVKVTSGVKLESNAKKVSRAVMAVIAATPDSCTMAHLTAETGYAKSRLYGVVHRLKQQGEIKSKERGVYVIN